jgi:dTDP-4-amino-4,6-dideoxygalactose transaminase
MGWNYRTQEMPCALTRLQLTRLDSYNAVARRNADYLSAELAKLPGVQPPYVPDDRVSNFHRYCLRLEPETLDFPLRGAAFRDRLQAALQAEGVDAVRWQHTPVPLQPLFQTQQGYGKGCPWSCRKLYGATYEYRAEQYPVTMNMLENSLIICSETYPIYAQPLAVLERYVDAFHKVFANLDQLLD